MAELCDVICDVVGAGELAGLTEEEVNVGVPVDDNEIRDVFDFPV